METFYDAVKEDEMKLFKNRSHFRRNDKTPIMIAAYNSDDYYSATMINLSENGMYVETKHIHHPGEDIYLKTIRSTSDPLNPEFEKSYRAKVKWCIKNEDSHYYGMGIQFCESLIHQLCKHKIMTDSFTGLWEVNHSDFS